VSPNTGTTAGGTGITITGSGFRNITSVTLGGVAITGLTVVSSTQITGTTASTTAGLKDAVVTSTFTSGTGVGAFTYVSPLTVTAMSPNYGYNPGGTVVNIIGSGFTGSETLVLGGFALTGVTFVSSTQLQATIPYVNPGQVGVKNLNVGSVTLNNAFTYYLPASNKSKYRSFSSTTVPAGSATYFHDVTWVQGYSIYVAVAQFSSGTDGIITSSDGSTWSRKTSPFTESGNTYLRVLASTSTSVIMTSGDNPNQNARSVGTFGNLWSQISGLDGQHSLANSPTLNTWIIPGMNKIYYSTDEGGTWGTTNITVNPLGCLWAGAPFNKFFVFPRTNADILYSSDGVTWSTLASSLDPSEYYIATAYSSDLQKIMTINNYLGDVYTSTDGTTWINVGSCTIIGQVRSLLWNSDMYAWFASGETGVAVSTDGIDWTKISYVSTDTNPDFTSKGIAYSNALDKFVTAHATMYVSDSATKGSINFGSGNYLNYTNSVDFQFGTSDFTIEWFQYQTTINANTQYILAYGTSFNIGITFDKKLEIVLGGSTVFSQTITNYFENQWVHFAVSRAASTLRVFVNGTQLGTDTPDSTNVDNASTVLCIGNLSSPVPANSFIGKLTNIHIMNGSARYTSGFARIAHEIVGNSFTKLLLPANSTAFLKDFSSSQRTASNNGCVANTSSPFL
jgi:hypothetical protein